MTSTATDLHTLLQCIGLGGLFSKIIRLKNVIRFRVQFQDSHCSFVGISSFFYPIVRSDVV